MTSPQLISYISSHITILSVVILSGMRVWPTGVTITTTIIRNRPHLKDVLVRVTSRHIYN